MAVTAETNFDEFRGKDCVFVADWLKTKGLHQDVTNTWNNWKLGTGVWEQVYSGNLLENLKWRTKEKQGLQMKQFG